MYFLYQIGLLMAKTTGILDINWLVIFAFVFIKELFSIIDIGFSMLEQRMNKTGVK